jgi:outer membrane receptor protein involved in Fe transport
MTRHANNAPGSTLGGAIADSHQTSLNPSLAVRYDATDRVSIRGAAYRAFRAPGLNNLYRSFSSTTSITLANPDLKPETLDGAEAGVDVRSRDLTLGATVFRYDTRSLIAAYRIQSAAGAPAAVIAVCGPTLGTCPATVNFNTNGQDATSRGAEMVGTWRPRSTLGVEAGYTFTSSYYTSTTNGDPVRAQLGAIPRHLETLGLTWTPSSRWSAHVNARHNDAMFLDVNHTIHQPAFTIVNASTSYRATERVEVYASVNNATTSAAGQTLGLLRSVTSGVRVRF